MKKNILEKIAKFLTFFGRGWLVIASLGLWVLPMLFGWNISTFSVNLAAGIVMIVTFFCFMLTGMMFWIYLENKKK